MKQSFANLFGMLGYLSLLLQWVWMSLVIGAPFMASDFFQDTFLPQETTTPVETVSMNIPEPIGILFMALAIIFAIGVSVYAIVNIPRTIARTGHKVTQKSAQVIVPHMTHHKHISTKRKKTLIERITWTVKVILALIPVAALLIRPDDIVGLSHGVVIGSGLFCAGATLLWFGVQFTIAKLAKLDPRQVW